MKSFEDYPDYQEMVNKLSGEWDPFLEAIEEHEIEIRQRLDALEKKVNLLNANEKKEIEKCC